MTSSTFMTMTDGQAVELINEAVGQALEYAERHGDHGDAYAHMPAESWTNYSTNRLIEQIERLNILNPGTVTDRYKEIPADHLAEIALEIFEMMPGTIYGPLFGNSAMQVQLEGYPVGEIEEQLDHLGIDPEQIRRVAEQCEAYVTESRGVWYAYATTDAVWYAIVDTKDLNGAIDDYFCAA